MKERSHKGTVVGQLRHLISLAANEAPHGAHRHPRPTSVRLVQPRHTDEEIPLCDAPVAEAILEGSSEVAQTRRLSAVGLVPSPAPGIWETRCGTDIPSTKEPGRPLVNPPFHGPETPTSILQVLQAKMVYLRAILLSALPVAFAALNEPCYGSGGVAGVFPLSSPAILSLALLHDVVPQSSQALTPRPSGVCVTTAACSASGGTTITGGCPADPSDVKCCSKTSCTNGASGNCRWTSDCAGTTVANQCPGPSAMKCCSSSATGFGGYSAPAIPSVGACKAVAVSGANAVVAAWPGRVRQIYCTRDCACPGTSDHCCGKAIDFMCSDAGGVSLFRS